MTDIFKLALKLLINDREKTVLQCSIETEGVLIPVFILKIQEPVIARLRCAVVEMFCPATKEKPCAPAKPMKRNRSAFIRGSRLLESLHCPLPPIL